MKIILFTIFLLMVGCVPGQCECDKYNLMMSLSPGEMLPEELKENFVTKRANYTLYKIRTIEKRRGGFSYVCYFLITVDNHGRIIDINK